MMLCNRLGLRAAIVAAALCSSSFTYGQPSGGNQPAGGNPGGAAVTPPTRVAIVNPTRILTEMQEWKDTRAKFEQERDSIKGEQSKRELALRDKKSALDALKPDSPGYDEKNKELVSDYIQADAWLKVTTADFDRRYKMALKNLFDKVTTSIAQVATRRGVDMVINDVRPQIDEKIVAQLNADQLVEVMSRRNVLFATAAIDLTNEVITEMDARYKSGK